MATNAKPPGPNKTTEGQIGPKFGNGNGTPSDAPPSGTIGPTPTEVAENAPEVPPNLHRFFLERHSPVWGLIDLTPWVTSCTWTLRVREPWTTINATLAVPFGQKNILPDPNDVIIVRGVDGAARAWGFAESTPDPALVADAQGMTYSPPTTINAVSWLMLMRKAMVFASPTSALAGRQEGTPSVGTYFTLGDWTAIATTILGSVAGDLNERMTTLIRMLAKLRLPKSLGAGFIGDFVAVVMNQTTSNLWADGMPCDPIRGPSLQNVQSTFPAASNALDVILGTLVPDRRLIEFWEDVKPEEKPNPAAAFSLALAQGNPGPSEATVTAATQALSTGLGPLIGQATQVKNQSQGGVGNLVQAAAATAARRLFGGTPFLVYRLAPFRTTSLTDYMDKDAAKRQLASLIQGPPGPDPASSDPLAKYYSDPTWDLSQGYKGIEGIDAATEIFSFQAGRSDSERINAVTVGLPGQPDNPIAFWEGAGLPIMNDVDVARAGLRLYRPNWPFFPPGSTDVIPYARITAALAAMMFLDNQRFYSGQFTLNLRSGAVGNPDLRIGRPCTIRLQTGIFQCYVDQASHSVTVGPKGEVVGRTTVQFSRGLYNDPALREAPARAAVRPSNMPVVPAQPVQKKDNTPTPSNRRRSPGVLFNGGFLPWPASNHPLDLKLLSKDLGQRQRRVQTGITQAILHTTDGADTTLTLSGTYDHFNRTIATNIAEASNGDALPTTPFPTTTIYVDSTDGFPAATAQLPGFFTVLIGTDVSTVRANVKYTGKTPISFTGCSTDAEGFLVQGSPVTNPGVDSHFVVEASGTIVQILDLAITAYQAGTMGVNVKSIGIDFVLPELINRPTQNLSLPWGYQTGFTITTNTKNTSSDFIYTPTEAQLAAVRQVVQWANRFLAVPLVAPAATGDPKTIAYYAGNWPAGIFHHAEVYKGRRDCLGVYIPDDIL